MTEKTVYKLVKHTDHHNVFVSAYMKEVRTEADVDALLEYSRTEKMELKTRLRDILPPLKYIIGQEVKKYLHTNGIMIFETKSLAVEAWESLGAKRFNYTILVCQTRCKLRLLAEYESRDVVIPSLRRQRRMKQWKGNLVDRLIVADEANWPEKYRF